MDKPTLAALEHLYRRLQSWPECWQWQPDPDWPSPCDRGDGHWQPVRQEPPGDFANVEQALGETLHPSIKAFFGAYYAEHLTVHHERGQVTLLGVWNEEDFRRLQENLIGHVLMKRRLGQPLTLFFACTDDDDLLLSVDNLSGEVVLEPVGQEAREVVALSLAEFLDSLTGNPS
ncbi:SecY-interacting protein [Gallaecimonas sp. GXIMD4217]|uniref:SecY-interacting protein n=1 Tax=Gallaecimonas sp. GXIMD4217 TaxID=3131927 RepID=UPI00311B384B